MMSPSSAALVAGGSRRRKRPGMSWTMLTARGASAHSSRRATGDISGRAASAAVGPAPGPDPVGVVGFFLGGGLDGRLGLMAVGFDEQLLLAARARFRHDVLERLHLLRGETAPLLDHCHSRDRRLDSERPKH